MTDDGPDPDIEALQTRIEELESELDQHAQELQRIWKIFIFLISIAILFIVSPVVAAIVTLLGIFFIIIQYIVPSSD